MRSHQERNHTKKLEYLSREHDCPPLSISNTVISYNLNYSLPKFVLDTLRLGPKSAVLDNINPKYVLAELDLFIKLCRSADISDETIRDINIKSLSYIKNVSDKSRHEILL